MPSNALPFALPSPPLSLLDNASLFIDFDGTLVELAERPDAVVVDDPLRDLLSGLAAALPGRVALVSGRSIEQLDGFIGPLAAELGLAGSHGAEHRWRDGLHHSPERPEALDAAESALREFARRHEGIVIEPKSYGVGLHYRLAPAHGERALEIAGALAEEHGLGLQPGKMMVELKLSAGDKGSAIRTFMDRAPMAGTVPVFLGDDLTDEPGFAVARELGGAGILVGQPRETGARYWLDGVSAARAWLAEALK